MNWLSPYELPILDAIATLHHPILDVFFRGVTLLGEYGLCSIVLGVVLTCIPKTRKVGICLLLALLAVVLSCNLTLKPWVGRLRPYEFQAYTDLLVAPLHDASFPSGHTCVSFATAFVLSKHWKKWAGVCYTVAGLIGFSRLYLYVHFPSDVLVGAVLGLGCGWLGCYLYSTLASHLSKPAH